LLELRRQLAKGEIPISKAIVQVLPELRGRVPDATLTWLASELQGYANSVVFYQSDKHDLPTYRIVTGVIKLVDPNGKVSDLEHPYAQRGRYFLSAPIAWLEDFAALPGQGTLVELPDLTALMGNGRGSIACQFTKEQLKGVLSTVRNRVIEVMTQVVTKK
jgi:hypothetical protein